MATIVRECTTNGCTVLIRETLGKQVAAPVCRWCQQGKAYNLKEVSPRGVALTPVPKATDTLWPWLEEKERDRRRTMPFWMGKRRGWAHTRGEEETWDT